MPKTCSPLMLIPLALAALLLSGCPRPLASESRHSPGNVALLRTALGSDKAAAAGPAVAAPEPTGWATLRGSFKIDGSAPGSKQLTITSDHSICMPGGQPVYANDLVLGDGGGIKNVVVYLTTKYPDGDPKWEHPDAMAATAEPPPFDQKQCVFLTHVFAMRAGTTLPVHNSDPVGHNTNISGGGGAVPANFTVPAGASAPYNPGGESAEPFAVACSIHPWMAAYGLVRKSPYFAVSNEQGEFEIKNLPAGVPLEFRVWQERARFIQDVTATGTIDKYSKGRMQLTLAPDEERQLEMVVAAQLFGGN